MFKLVAARFCKDEQKLSHKLQISLSKKKKILKDSSYWLEIVWWFLNSAFKFISFTFLKSKKMNLFTHYNESLIKKDYTFL